MSAWISTTKAAALLTSVQLNPEILTEDAAYVTELVDREARWLTAEIGHTRYPELSKGYSLSGVSASEDISAETTNRIEVSIDTAPFFEIALTLAGLTSGAAIATELQTKIRAIGTGGFKFVTVTFNAGDASYEITSGTFGWSSRVCVRAKVDSEEIAVALKLSPEWGGTEYVGANALDRIDAMVVAQVAHWYNTTGVEGMRSFSTPGEGSFTADDMPPQVARFIHTHRRLVI